MKRRQHDDDDIVRDGQRLRVPLMLMDGMQRSVAREGVRITDGSGGTQGLHRPGFRIPTDDTRKTQQTADAYNEAFAAYERELVDAWKTPVGFGGDPDITGQGERGQQGSREGDPCMVDGRPGTLRMGADGLYCEIDDEELDDAHDGRSVQQRMQDHQERMSDVYAAHDAKISQAWRRK